MNIVLEAVAIQPLSDLVVDMCVLFDEFTNVLAGSCGIQAVDNQPAVFNGGDNSVIGLASDRVIVDDDFAFSVGAIGESLNHSFYFLSFFVPLL
jgi:hypothetical protein